MARANAGAGTDIPVIGLGTGGAVHLTSDQCKEVVRQALDLGYRHVDTAALYDNHEGVGIGISNSSVPREEVLLGTKVLPEQLDHSGVIESLEQSKDELGVDQIDIGYIHFPRGKYDPPETYAALDELVDRGTIRNIGVSNFTVSDLQTALDHADHPILVNQIEYHPLYQQPEIVDFARKKDIHTIAYAPLARGRIFSLEPIQEIAEAYDESPATIALAWLTSKPDVSVIVKSTNPDHLASNLRAPSVELNEEDVRKIESIEEQTRLVNPEEY